MKYKYLISLFIILQVIGCSTAKDTTGVWVNKEKAEGKSFNKIFLLVVTADPEARTQLENDLEAAAKAKGYVVVKSVDVMPVSVKDPKAPTKEEVVSAVNQAGADAALIASLLKKEEAVTYTPSTEVYSAKPYSTWTGNSAGYYSYYQPTVYHEGYFNKDGTYVMQSNLYEAATQEIMWSVQSSVFNPSSLKKFSKDFTATLIKQLEKAKLLKK